ncbi:hypothetical protein M422DRAFT_69134 [Sphaerobolus stellatus SS14]|uniref:F-box domain-containing protein n=1 Tax=Sphaerobolus stellatus (strain SS14) TaxID=990650 RepID=A0A0C9VA74_SPHS4|nr:hypothetical protein M422DRAFT_69134 [Sphaerobolus stellatus SS14]
MDIDPSVSETALEKSGSSMLIDDDVSNLTISPTQLNIDSNLLDIRRQNDEILINTLPLEILTQIFLFSPSVYPPTISKPWFSASYNQMGQYYYIAWVCYKWREIVMNNAVFWTHVDIYEHPEGFINQVLHLSKESGLRLYSTIPRLKTTPPPIRSYIHILQTQSQLLRHVLQTQWHRIHSIHLNIMDRIWNMIYPILTDAAPALRHFTVIVESGGDVTRSNQPLPMSHLFSRASPARGLRFYLPDYGAVNTLVIDWASLIDMTFPHLRDLRLGTRAYAKDHSLLPSILELLRGVRQLETLEIFLHYKPNSLPGNIIMLHGFMPSKEAIIEMPRLTTLMLSSGESLLLLPYLTLPQLRLLKLKIDTSIDAHLLPRALVDVFNFASIISIHGCIERDNTINSGYACLIGTSTLSTDESTKGLSCMHLTREVEDKSYDLVPPPDLPEPGQFAFHICSPDGPQYFSCIMPKLQERLTALEELVFSSDATVDDDMVLEEEQDHDHWYNIQCDLLRASASLHTLVLNDYNGARLIKNLPDLCPGLENLEYIQQYDSSFRIEIGVLDPDMLLDIVENGCRALKKIRIIQAPDLLNYMDVFQAELPGVEVEIVDSECTINRNDWQDYDTHIWEDTDSDSAHSNNSFPDWEPMDDDFPRSIAYKLT